jgi:hypothetical protein
MRTPSALWPLPVLVSCLAGCHTVAAVRQLSTPSPVNQLSVRVAPRGSALEWRAGYGTAGPADPFLTSMADRTVENEGRWDLPAGAVVCVRGGDDFEPLQIGQAYRVFIGTGAEGGAPLEAAELPRAATAGCTHVLRVENSGRYARALRLVPAAGSGAPLGFPLPQERPAADPRRWGWLAAAPFLDVVTIVAIPVVGIFLLSESAG